MVFGDIYVTKSSVSSKSYGMVALNAVFSSMSIMGIYSIQESVHTPKGILVSWILIMALIISIGVLDGSKCIEYFLKLEDRGRVLFLGILMSIKLNILCSLIQTIGPISSSLWILIDVLLFQRFQNGKWIDTSSSCLLMIAGFGLNFWNSLSLSNLFFQSGILLTMIVLDKTEKWIHTIVGKEHTIHSFEQLYGMTLFCACAVSIPHAFWDYWTADNAWKDETFWNFGLIGIIAFGQLISSRISIIQSEIAICPFSIRLLIQVVSLWLTSWFLLCLGQYASIFSPTFFVSIVSFGCIVISLWMDVNRNSKSIHPLSSSTASSSNMKGILMTLWQSEDSRSILLFLLFNVSFMFVELVVGIYTNSLGLITDAGHMFFDNGALFIGLAAAYISKWPADAAFSYGYGRIDILSGFVNSLLLLVMAFGVLKEGIHRVFDPPNVSTDHLLITSVVGLLVNIVGLVCFHDHAHGGQGCSHGHSHGDASHSHSHGSHGHSHGESHSEQEKRKPSNDNIYGIYLHILADTLGSVGVIFSSLLIEYKGWYIADPICSIMVALVMIASTIPMVKHTAYQLIQRLPIDQEHEIQHVLSKLRQLPHISDIHEVHFWNLSSKELVGSLRIFISIDGKQDQLLSQIRNVVQGAIPVKHLTIELEREINEKVYSDPQYHHHHHHHHQPHHHNENHYVKQENPEDDQSHMETDTLHFHAYHPPQSHSNMKSHLVNEFESTNTRRKTPFVPITNISDVVEPVSNFSSSSLTPSFFKKPQPFTNRSSKARID